MGIKDVRSKFGNRYDTGIQQMQQAHRTDPGGKTEIERFEMMQLPIIPCVGAGPLRLGMPLAEARAAVGSVYHSFKKNPESAMPSDAFENEGIYVYYKQPGLCQAIEMATPACPLLQGQELLGQPYSQARNLVRSLDSKISEDGAGLTSLDLGIGLYAPSAGKDEQSLVESVIVFEKGYYG